MSTVVWFDGRIRQEHEQILTAVDRGLTVGDGVFDTCVVVSGQPFALRRHVERLARSAALAGLPAPPADIVSSAAREVAGQLSGGTGRLRITWTAGPATGGSSRSEGTRPTLVLTANAETVVHPSPAGQGRQVHTGVVVVPWVRNERSPLVGVKSISYGDNVLAIEHARSHGGSEAIFGNTRGELCEGAATNVFLETGSEVLTPPLASGCLAGVTRELVLEWGAAAGMPVREVTIPLSDFQAATHAAVTSSTRGVVPVDAVDGRELAPGPLTLRLQEVFAERVAESLDP